MLTKVYLSFPFSIHILCFGYHTQKIRRISCLYELEKQKVNDNESCYRSEMEALKVEQLEIYKEFREMCESLKKKDVELLNKTKQTKLLTAEWRQKEDATNDKILLLEREICERQTSEEKTTTKLRSVTKENEFLISRLHHAEEQLQTVYDNMSRVEELLYQAKGDGLYN